MRVLGKGVGQVENHGQTTGSALYWVIGRARASSRSLRHLSNSKQLHAISQTTLPVPPLASLFLAGFPAASPVPQRPHPFASLLHKVSGEAFSGPSGWRPASAFSPL